MTFNFNHGESEQIFTWLIRFSNVEDFNFVQTKISQALFEEKNGYGGWEKLKVGRSF